MNSINVLCIGDIVGKPGRAALAKQLKAITSENNIHFVVANIENAAGGFGVTKRIYKECSELGIQAFTSGNHIFDKREIMDDMESYSRLVRPANFPDGCPGEGYKIFKFNTIKIGIINLMGRVFMGTNLDCPFKKFDTIHEQIKDDVDIIFVDFHAETTSEKQAFFWYADGRASLAWGTHTHIQTADDRILPQGLGCLTDLGMTGIQNGILGMERDPIIKRFLTQLPSRFVVPQLDDVMINGIISTVSISEKKCTSINRVFDRFKI
jgi:2',3'-cyclic-nucleotide 2'-phosphodiesterase